MNIDFSGGLITFDEVTYTLQQVELVDDNFIHLVTDGGVFGRIVSDMTINGVSYPTANAVIGFFGAGYAPEGSGIDFAARQANINAMNQYMLDLVGNNLTESNFNLFLADTALLVQGYLGGGTRLITWVSTINAGGYNATTIGMKTKTAYRGVTNNAIEGVNGNYDRVNDILTILNNY